jgi:hypothetical protein
MKPISKLGADALMTPRGQVIGFGRLKIPKMPKIGFDLEIPLLSFAVTRRPGGEEYIATCIHLQIDGYGKDDAAAMNDMVGGVWYFLRESFKHEESRNDAWDNIFDLFKSNPRSDALWDAYHALQIEFAKNGIATDRHSDLHERIKELEEQVRKLEADIVGKDAYISQIMGSMIIEYKHERAA